MTLCIPDFNMTTFKGNKREAQYDYNIRLSSDRSRVGSKRIVKFYEDPDMGSLYWQAEQAAIAELIAESLEKGYDVSPEQINIMRIYIFPTE